jgi:hypothetical protein
MIDASAPIVPNVGLGGLRLRMNARELQPDLEVLDSGTWDPAQYRLARPFEARYRFAEGAVEAAVDVRNGKLFRLRARSGYRGTLRGVGVPSRARDALSALPGFAYDEAEELILSSGEPGVALELAEIDPDPADVPNLQIVAISVFAPEAFETAAGMDGIW